jgi:PAS domain S-box-containing protein
MAILWGKLSASSVVILIPVAAADKCLSSPRLRLGMSFAFCGVQDRNRRVAQRLFEEGIHEQGRAWQCALAAFVLVLSLLVIQGFAAAQVPPVRRVLILNEVNPFYPAITIINQGIQTALSNSRYHLEFYSESLDIGLFPDPAVQQEFRDFYIRKYQNRQPDVIITIGPTALKFMKEAHQRAFPGVPIVFCEPMGDAPSAPALDSDFTGVESDMAPAETLQIALKLQPGTEHLVVLGGVSDRDRHEQALLTRQIKGLTHHLDVTYMTDVAVPELPARLKHLPPHSLVLLLSYAQDAKGTGYKSSEIGPLVAAAANAPVFSFYDVYLNHGEVGGYLSDFNEQGKVAGGMALKILQGEKPQDIPRVKGVNTYMFDWRAVKRWGLKESEIPPGSIILNRQPTMWESNKDTIIGGISLILLEALAIGGLLWQRARRREVEADLIVTNDRLRESEGRFRLVANTAPVMIWMSGLDKLCNYFNKTWLEFTGPPLEAELGDGWLDGVHAEDRKPCMDTYIQAFDRREPFSRQYRLRRHDGEYRWVLDHGVPRFNADGSFAGYIGSVIDITVRKEAEEALAAVSGKLVEVQEQERTRIARDLHDDINQQLALLAVEIEQLKQAPPDSVIELTNRLAELKERLSEISTGVQSISHELHSPQLEFLGIVAAMKSFCDEFGSRQAQEIDFRSNVIPKNIPHDVSLCLFRVLQEALHNAAKHSNARILEVTLDHSANQLQLTISDHGSGFDVETATRKGGLGLTSMRERVRLVSGTIEIESKPMAGTRIQVRVPVGVQEVSELAVR